MIYLDANSSATLRPEAAAAVQALLKGAAEIRNPSSIHAGGREARKLLAQARTSIKGLLDLGAWKSELIFTSGGTEACCSLVDGFLEGSIPSQTHIATSAIEHAAMLEAVRKWERRGARCTFAMPDQSGSVSVDAFCSSIRPDTALVSLMAANNETGVIQPIIEIAEFLRASGYAGALICDYTQALGKGLFTARDLFAAGVDALVVSAHKIGAPAGIGTIVLNTGDSNRCLQFAPLLVGGAQESGFRAGTENLIGAVAFGAAAKAMRESGPSEISVLRKHRDQLWAELQRLSPWIELITPTEPDCGLPNTLFVRCPGVRGDDAVVALDLAGVACSTGSACASGKQSISHVVQAMGFTGASGREFLRFSLDWSFTDEDASRAAQVISATLERVRALAATEREEGVA